MKEPNKLYLQGPGSTTGGAARQGDGKREGPWGPVPRVLRAWSTPQEEGPGGQGQGQGQRGKVHGKVLPAPLQPLFLRWQGSRVQPRPRHRWSPRPCCCLPGHGAMG